MEKENRRDGEKRHRHKEHRDDRKHRKDERYDRYVWEDKEKERDRDREREREREKPRDRRSGRARDESEKQPDERKESKRKRDSVAEDKEKEAAADAKRNRSEDTAAQVPPVVPPPNAANNVHEAYTPAPENPAAPLTEIEKAKRLLLLRKELNQKLKKLPDLPAPTPGPAAPANEYVPNPANLAAVKRAQECVARLGFQQPPGSTFHVPGTVAPSGPKTVKAPVLRLDAQGREIDENGVVVDRRKSSISTLKVNINKQKKEAFQILRPELEEDPINNPHFDPSMGIDRNKLVRSKKNTFQFVEEGRFTKKAEIMRLNNRFGAAKAREIRSKQAALAKAKAEGDINPNLIEVTERIFKDDKHKDPIPSLEWWDYAVLPTQAQSYDDVFEDSELKFKKDKINIYVEHPVPIEPPAEAAPPPPQPLKLTKKEQKKMRTQRRLAREKERQELIRQGKIEPPKGKVKMSNLMTVLGAEATQDPTRLEHELRSAAAERERAHTDRNLARKLTPAERREKKEKRLFDESSSLETIVAVFRVKDISHPKTRFKVDINAAHNKLTGCAIITDDMTVVIVEGCPKSIKRYSKLMLRRIDWSAKEEAEAGGGEEEEEAEQGGGGEEAENKCVQVWQGSVARPAFDKFFLQKFHTPGAARKYLADAGVGHYWDCALHYKEE